MIEITHDDKGRPRVATTTLPAALVDFLETDVRANLAWCDDLLAGLARAATGQSFFASGNLYDLTASVEGVEIVNGYDEAVPPVVLTLSECRAALTAWRRAILPPSDDGKPRTHTRDERDTED